MAALGPGHLRGAPCVDAARHLRLALATGHGQQLSPEHPNRDRHGIVDPLRTIMNLRLEPFRGVGAHAAHQPDRDHRHGLPCLSGGNLHFPPEAARTGPDAACLHGPVARQRCRQGVRLVVAAQSNGVINQALRAMGLIDAPLRLMLNETGVVIGSCTVICVCFFASCLLGRRSVRSTPICIGGGDAGRQAVADLLSGRRAADAAGAGRGRRDQFHDEHDRLRNTCIVGRGAGARCAVWPMK